LLCAFLSLGGRKACAAVDICLINPVGNEMYKSGDTVDIEWEAENTPACAWTVNFWYKKFGSGGDYTLHYIGSVPYQNQGAYPFTIPWVSYTSHFRVIAKMLTDGNNVCDSVESNTFTVLPSDATRALNLLTPKPTPCGNNELILNAGEDYEITWDAGGCQANSLWLSIYYATSWSIQDGYNWQLITHSARCYSGSYTWTVPMVDTDQAKIKLEWYDLEATHINPFTITTEYVNHCPTADAGDDQTVNEHTVVNLDGTQSSDPEGDYIYYYWEIVNPEGYYESQVTLSSPYTSTPYFTAPNVPVEVDLDFRLTVDNSNSRNCVPGPDADIVTVTVRPLNSDVSYFNPMEGWFKTPVTIYGENLGGSKAYLGGTQVSEGAIPLDSDEEYTFFTPDVSFGSYSVEVGSDTAYYQYEVIDVPYQWKWGFQFSNPSGYDLSWSDYVNCFGRDAVTWEGTCCDWDAPFDCGRHCHNGIAQDIFDGYVETMTRAGSCWGMSVASLKFLYEDYALPYTGHDHVRDLVWDNVNPTGITEEIRQLHISQLSAEVIEYLVDHLGDSLADHVDRIQSDTEHWKDKSHPDYTPGVISLQNIAPGSVDADSFQGHAMVPDHVEQISDDVYRIYVYDSNRPGLSISPDNNDTSDYPDITDFDNYPYITVDTSGSVEDWSFVMSDGSIWEANTSYDITISAGSSEIDIPFYGLYYFPAGIAVRNHYTFPASLRGLGMILSGAADCGVQESDGDRLGYDSTGELHFEIADGIPIVPASAGSFQENEFYWLRDGTYFVDLYGLKDKGTYDWLTLNGNTLFAVNSSELDKGEKDSVMIENGNRSMEMTTTEKQKSFSMKMVKTLTKSGKTYQRVFEIIDTRMDDNGKAWFRATPDQESLVYENSSGIESDFTARFIQVQLSPEPKIEDINTKTLIVPDVKMKSGSVLKMSPDNWENLGQAQAQTTYYKSGTMPQAPGDADYDGDTDGRDLEAFRRAYDAAAVEADLDITGEVDSKDLEMFASRFGKVY